MPDQNFDVIIIGGGMAGLTAGIYAARQGLSTAVVEQMMAGAQIINLERIENFPGFPQGIAGYELGPATQEQAMNAGVEVLMDTVASVSADGDYLRVAGEGGGSYLGKAVIMAAGSTLRTLGIPGEEEFLGRGVSHCASCPSTPTASSSSTGATAWTRSRFSRTASPPSRKSRCGTTPRSSR